MEFHTPYNRSPYPGTINAEPTRTQQQFAGDANINTIIARYRITGILPERRGVPRYGDFTGLQDFQTAQGIVAEANQAFQALPATLRRRFNNDPSQFVAFVEDEENRAEAEKLGLVPKKEVKPTEIPAANAAKNPAEKPADSMPT